MSFLNKYNKLSHSYSKAKKIGNAIYSVGNIDVSSLLAKTTQAKNIGNNEALSSSPVLEGLITKTDLNGDVVWEKRYNLLDGNNQSFDNVIGCDNGDVIVIVNTTMTDYQNISLARIDSAGNVVWHKSYPPLFHEGIDRSSNKGNLIKIGVEMASIMKIRFLK
jgi:hypothetical protein